MGLQLAVNGVVTSEHRLSSIVRKAMHNHHMRRPPIVGGPRLFFGVVESHDMCVYEFHLIDSGSHVCVYD